MTRPFREGDYVSYFDTLFRKEMKGYVCDAKRDDCGVVDLDGGGSWWHDYSTLTLISPATDASIVLTRSILREVEEEESGCGEEE